ncbi:MAG: FAD-dependent oxidoreductase, partial [Candidatus Thalassarchaeaceae archaeon]|nr:FAD-dependent oxidoreductase [Candidatus Thalassarchaeaceae archaeon]
MSFQDPVQPKQPPESFQEGAEWWMREAALAIGLVVLILTSMWIATGIFPPMVVVESGSMMHDLEDGSIGSIDPGDLVLVMNPARADIVTYAEATQKGNDDFGYESHGMPGDVAATGPTKPFQIPLGALFPRDGPVNLLAACKNIGTTHMTNG